ncbi:hypothetical protein EYZ11_009039 [Aspergillus tanneri]|uniref:Uncharacterized protein n=1 Tax=Aspergillus tanneri TaxID=1220188 RepID=A0A4S3JB42_9EURO|nr:hypothetical protein EYZ11_009039 [Aspergillus tanneri]
MHAQTGRVHRNATRGCPSSYAVEVLDYWVHRLLCRANIGFMVILPGHIAFLGLTTGDPAHAEYI